MPLSLRELDNYLLGDYFVFATGYNWGSFPSDTSGLSKVADAHPTLNQLLMNSLTETKAHVDL